MTDRTTPDGAAPAPRRGIAPRWRTAAAALVCLLLSAAGSALADSDSRGNWLCSDADFEIVKDNYRAHSDDVNSRIDYAHCLIVKGRDSEGLAILHNIVKHSDQPARVRAAWKVASYVKTGGIFEDTTDENNINEAIEASLKVIFFITSDRNYPDGNEIYEAESQMELKTHYRLPLLYFEKFKKGAKGTDNIRLLTSPSYEGDRDLRTYPEYSPYTINSLERMIEFADVCIDLPLKRHFQHRVYEETKAECRVLKEAAQALLPLERERLVLLNTDSCSDDLPQCVEHREVKSDIISIIRKANAEVREIIERHAAPSQQ